MNVGLTSAALGSSITIKNELEDLIIPLSKEEFSQLESNILKEGCRESVIAWENGDELILIDGHNRYKICTKHNLPFNVSKLDFKSLDEVKIWMLNNQLGRRNLNPDQLSYYRGLKYLGLKRKKGGYDNVLSKGQKELSTAESLSREFKVSNSTIKRDAKFAEALEIITKSNPKLKNDILVGREKFKKSDISLLVQADNEKLTKFKNASDLHNKLNIIKNAVFEEIEDELKTIEDRKKEEELNDITSPDQLFADKETRIKNIKGRIISVMNKAIRDRDIESIAEMKNLIEKLEVLLSSE
ncbi:MAG: hypothetical protein AAFN93_04540 [Bacteroidota bacterium]